MDRFNIANMAKGALLEQADGEIQRVLDNIADPNTDIKKARKVQINLTFKPVSREDAYLDIQTKSGIVPYNSVTTQIYIGRDNNGQVAASEYQKGTLPGQTALQYDAETGEVLEDAKDSKEGRKIVNINR